VLLYGLGENTSKYSQNGDKVTGIKAVVENASGEKQAVENTPVVQSKRSKKKVKKREKKVIEMLKKIGEMPPEVYAKMDLRMPSRGAFDKGKKVGVARESFGWETTCKSAAIHCACK
jgi:hypothetical protein